MNKSILGIFLAISIAGCGTSTLKREQANLHLEIGTGHLIKGHFPQALHELQLAEELDPNNAMIQNNLGLAYFVRKNYDLAQKHISRALVLEPKYSDARNNYGRLFIELARYDDAIAELKIVTKDLTYNNPEKALVNLGLAYLKKGDFNTALDNFKRSLETNNKFCPSHNYLGQVLFQTQKYQSALEAFDTALKLCNNRYDEPHYYGALSLFKLGYRDRGIARLEEVIKFYPESDYSIQAQSMLKIMR